jgi:hypothetical protein
LTARRSIILFDSRRDCVTKKVSQATYFNWKKKYDGLLPTVMRSIWCEAPLALATLELGTEAVQFT